MGRRERLADALDLVLVQALVRRRHDGREVRRRSTTDQLAHAHERPQRTERTVVEGLLDPGETFELAFDLDEIRDDRQVAEARPRPGHGRHGERHHALAPADDPGLEVEQLGRLRPAKGHELAGRALEQDLLLLRQERDGTLARGTHVIENLPLAAAPTVGVVDRDPHRPTAVVRILAPRAFAFAVAGVVPDARDDRPREQSLELRAQARTDRRSEVLRRRLRDWFHFNGHAGRATRHSRRSSNGRAMSVRRGIPLRLPQARCSRSPPRPTRVIAIASVSAERAGRGECAGAREPRAPQL